MLSWIIGSSAKFRLLIIAVAATLLAVGIGRLPGTDVEALPDFGPVRVEVQTEALGLSPEEAENLITNPMEQEFFTGIPWLHKIRSKSAPGLSAVEMTFESGANDVRARQVVQERLTMVPALPAVSKPPYVIQPSATTNRVLIFSMIWPWLRYTSRFFFRVKKRCAKIRGEPQNKNLRGIKLKVGKTHL